MRDTGGFKAECPCQLCSARALETGVDTSGAGTEGAGRARLTGGKGAAQADRGGLGTGRVEQGAAIGGRRASGVSQCRGRYWEGISV